MSSKSKYISIHSKHKNDSKTIEIKKDISIAIVELALKVLTFEVKVSNILICANFTKNNIFKSVTQLACYRAIQKHAGQNIFKLKCMAITGQYKSLWEGFSFNYSISC